MMNEGEKTYWVYILENYKRRYYISVTSDLEQRLEEHKLEKQKRGAETSDFELVYERSFSSGAKAIAVERALRQMSNARLRKYIQQEEDLLERGKLFP